MNNHVYQNLLHENFYICCKVCAIYMYIFCVCVCVCMLIKIQQDATVCRYLFTAKSLYMFLVLLMMGTVTPETCRVTLQ